MGISVEQEKFALLAASVSDVTWEQYIRRWRRWARFCACVDSSPWPTTSAVGWSNTIIDFIAWGYKIIGIPHGTLAKRFSAIRFTHISEGYDGRPLRAHRVKSAIKAAKLRWKTRKKVPRNTDLLRWIRPALGVGGISPSLSILIRCGEVYLWRFSAAQAYLNYSILLHTTRDSSMDILGGLIYFDSLIKDGPGKRRETRSLRANPSILCHAQALFLCANGMALPSIRITLPSPHQLFALKWCMLRKGPVPLMEFRCQWPTTTRSEQGALQRYSQQVWIG